MASHGKVTVFKVDNSAGTLTDISTRGANVDFSGMNVDMADVSTFGSTAKKGVPGLKSGNFTVDGPWDATIDAHLSSIVGGISSGTTSFEYGPEGSTTGKRKYTGECWCTAYSVKGGVDSAVTYTANFQIDGDLTTGTY